MGIDWIYCCCDWYCNWVQHQACPWLPSICFRGYGASGFITYASAINVGIARWEPFRKSMQELHVDFDKLFTKVLIKNRTASALADDRFASEFQVTKRRCETRLSSIKAENSAWWRQARKVAWLSALFGGAMLFFQMSVGFLGMFFFFAPLLIIIANRKCGYDIKKHIKSIVDGECERILTQQLIFNKTDAERVSNTIDKIEHPDEVPK